MNHGVVLEERCETIGAGVWLFAQSLGSGLAICADSALKRTSTGRIDDVWSRSLLRPAGLVHPFRTNGGALPYDRFAPSTARELNYMCQTAGCRSPKWPTIVFQESTADEDAIALIDQLWHRMRLINWRATSQRSLGPSLKSIDLRMCKWAYLCGVIPERVNTALLAAHVQTINDFRGHMNSGELGRIQECW